MLHGRVAPYRSYLAGRLLRLGCRSFIQSVSHSSIHSFILHLSFVQSDQVRSYLASVGDGRFRSLRCASGGGSILIGWGTQGCRVGLRGHREMRGGSLAETLVED